jgi:GNAT superfamily N-acetyltransferase
MSFEYEPPIDTAKNDEPFFQTLRLMLGEQEIGRCRWHVGNTPDEGVAQLVELFVQPPYRRQGYGGRIMREMFAQAQGYFGARKLRFRRVWLAAEHKGQINARAFLTSHGYHHMATVPDLLKDQDQLIYTKPFT